MILTDTELAIEEVIARVECHTVRNAQTRLVTGYMLSADEWRSIRGELRRIALAAPSSGSSL